MPCTFYVKHSGTTCDYGTGITVIVALTLNKAGGCDALTELRMASAPSSKYILPGAAPMHTKLSKVRLGPLQLFPVLFNHKNKGFWLIS